MTPAARLLGEQESVLTHMNGKLRSKRHETQPCVRGKALLGVFWSPFPNISGNWCGKRSTTIFETPEWTKLNLESPSGLPFICSAWHITGLSTQTNICCWKMKGVCNFTYCPVTQDFEMCFPLSHSVNRWNIGHIFLVGEKTY